MNLSKDDYDILVKELEAKGYHKSKGHYKNEDYAFWKSFHVTYDDPDDSDTKRIGYQVAILIFDWRDCGDPYTKDYGIQFEFLVGRNPHVDRFDFTISDSIVNINQFEELAEEVYQKICKRFIFEKFEKKEDY